MYNNQRTGTKHLLGKRLTVGLALIVAALIAFGLWHHFHANTTSGNSNGGTANTAAKTSQSAKPAKKVPTSNNSASRNAGGSTDTNGQTSATTDPSQWTTSSSGLVTVKQPIANSTLKSGDSLSGSAKNVSKVNWRLVDDKVGVIATGALNVVNGNFSGILHFNPQGNSGHLDVFSTNSQGVEYNEVRIDLSY